MNHDITHCRGIDCPIKEDCFRYKAHVDAQETHYEYPLEYFIDGLLCIRAKEARKGVRS